MYPIALPVQVQVLATCANLAIQVKTVYYQAAKWATVHFVLVFCVLLAAKDIN